MNEKTTGKSTYPNFQSYKTLKNITEFIEEKLKVAL